MTDCARESDVLEAVSLGRLDLVRDHLETCASCAEVAEVAGLFRRDLEAGNREAHVPSAGAVWWRATIRARAEAAQTVSQPITLVQGIAAACITGFVVAFAGMAWRTVSGFSSVGDFLVQLRSNDEIAGASALVLQHALPLALGLAACLVIAPVALYFALSDE